MNISKKSQTPVYRTATREDLADIAALEKQQLGDLACSLVILRQLFDLHGSHWVVADVDGHVRGYALVGINAAQRAWVLGLAVAAGYQRRGFGTALLAQAISVCRAALVDRVYITVRPTNQRAANLYKNAGFLWAGHEQRYFGEGEPRDVLVHRIQRAPVGPPIADPKDKRWLKESAAATTNSRIPLLWWK
ncbi:GNAT family N-acetyltransferase [Nocardia sp. GCM10030253]|uniref:GNAT family N-acetyltransferase n=1 Tax=Nocardia sp. GCM10030253 TaxID=3273404 RepID=UPI0036336875